MASPADNLQNMFCFFFAGDLGGITDTRGKVGTPFDTQGVNPKNRLTPGIRDGLMRATSFCHPMDAMRLAYTDVYGFILDPNSFSSVQTDGPGRLFNIWLQKTTGKHFGKRGFDRVRKANSGSRAMLSHLPTRKRGEA